MPGTRHGHGVRTPSTSCSRTPSTWVRSGSTGASGTRIQTPVGAYTATAPQTQWEGITSEALRIIDDETWDAVQRRLRSRQHLFSGRRSATTHLLSGLLVCDECGGRFSIVARVYYGCRNHSESGTCPNDLRIRREAIENLVIGELARHLPAWIEALSIAATRQPRVNSDSDAQDTRQRLGRLRKQAQALLQAIRTGVFVDGP
jgi:site-specific DNA recombinase